MFKKLIKDCFTGKNCKNYDLYRIIIFMGCIVFFFLSTGETLKGHDFKPIEFGTGFGLILAGGAGGIALKKDTEPESDDGK